MLVKTEQGTSLLETLIALTIVAIVFAAQQKLLYSVERRGAKRNALFKQSLEDTLLSTKQKGVSCKERETADFILTSCSSRSKVKLFFLKYPEIEVYE